MENTKYSCNGGIYLTVPDDSEEKNKQTNASEKFEDGNEGAGEEETREEVTAQAEKNSGKEREIEPESRKGAVRPGQVRETTVMDIRKALESILSKKDKILRSRQQDELTIEQERDKKIEAVRNDAELSLGILEETLGRDLKMVQEMRQKKTGELRTRLENENGLIELRTRLEEAKRKREGIEKDIDGLSPELKAKYEKKFMEDLETALSLEKDIAAELMRKTEEIEEKIAAEIEKTGLKGVPDEGKIRSQFEAERTSIEQKLQAQIIEIQRTYERKRNDIYQSYLRALKELKDEGLRELKGLINSLPRDKRLPSLAVFEFQETLRDIEKASRKFALDLRKKIEERKMESLEKRLNAAEDEVGGLRKEKEALEKERERLKKALEKKEKRPDTAELRKKIETEIREELEPELRTELEKRIRTELEKEFRERAEKRPVKKVREEQRYPFVRCPECGIRIEVKSNKRPLIVKCPGCGREYTLKPKAPREQAENSYINTGHDAHSPVNASPANGEEEGVRIGDEMNNFYTDQYFPVANSGVVPDQPASPVSDEKPVGTKTVICPYCGKSYILPANFTRKITCSCGRRIRTI